MGGTTAPSTTTSSSSRARTARIASTLGRSFLATAARYNNKCVLADSKNIGTTSGCDCPGAADGSKRHGGGVGSDSERRDGGGGGVRLLPPPSQCGVEMHNNAYFARPELPGNVTISCAGPVLLYDWLASGSDARSSVYEMPPDALLMAWARELLGLGPEPGPKPPMPEPLPPQPAPTFPHSCVGRCWREGHCCADMVSGCSQPSCYQGCALAAISPDLATCNAQCEAAGGKCSFTYRNTTLSMCNNCASVTPPQECAHQGTCEDVASCKDGCKNHFNQSWFV